MALPYYPLFDPYKDLQRMWLVYKGLLPEPPLPPQCIRYPIVMPYKWLGAWGKMEIPGEDE